MIYRTILKQGLLLLILFAGFLSFVSLAATKAELWEVWQQSNPQAKQSIDHQVWQSLLSRYVKTSPDGVNRFAYNAVTSRDKLVLKEYISALSNIPISDYNREEQLPYWINLYNAVTVDVVLDEYPVSSIRKIKNGIFSFGPWGQKRLVIEGRKVSLDDIEHRILRPLWKDPRIHYAVNCASIGCPNLRQSAFTKTTVESDLTEAATEFINHPRAARVVAGQLVVSSIYKWFKLDFGGSDIGVIKHLRQYAAPSLLEMLSSVTEIDDDQYDWGLNEVNAR